MGWNIAAILSPFQSQQGMADTEEARPRRKENLDQFDPELLDDEEEYEDDDEVRWPNTVLET